jgi:mRNA interferase MazF
VVVVSNDARNRALREVLVVPFTTKDKSMVPTAVPASEDDPCKGWIMCDAIQLVPKAHLSRTRGPLSPTTLARVEAALLDTLGIKR